MQCGAMSADGPVCDSSRVGVMQRIGDHKVQGVLHIMQSDIVIKRRTSFSTSIQLKQCCSQTFGRTARNCSKVRRLVL